MIRKSILALAAVSALVTSALIPTTADAYWNDRYGWHWKNYHYAPYPAFKGYRYFHGPRFYAYGPSYHGWRHFGWRRPYWY
jgi:hypothetical protein